MKRYAFLFLFNSVANIASNIWQNRLKFCRDSYSKDYKTEVN